jgi:hypothetical protein
MPRKDGTGPRGMGPKTGRGLGQCNTGNTPSGTLDPMGRGMNKGQGAGRGRGMGSQNGTGGRRGKNK